MKVQVEFNPKVVHSYRLVGYENRLLKKEDFNNDKIDAGLENGQEENLRMSHAAAHDHAPTFVCPACGAAMIVIEQFERGHAPRVLPSSAGPPCAG